MYLLISFIIFQYTHTRCFPGTCIDHCHIDWLQTQSQKIFTVVKISCFREDFKVNFQKVLLQVSLKRQELLNISSLGWLCVVGVHELFVLISSCCLYTSHFLIDHSDFSCILVTVNLSPTRADISHLKAKFQYIK